jgi:hypothetical protein
MLLARLEQKQIDSLENRMVKQNYHRPACSKGKAEPGYRPAPQRIARLRRGAIKIAG